MKETGVVGSTLEYKKNSYFILILVFNKVNTIRDGYNILYVKKCCTINSFEL